MPKLHKPAAVVTMLALLLALAASPSGPTALADGKGTDIGGPERAAVRSDRTRFGLDPAAMTDAEKAERLAAIEKEYEGLRRNQDLVQVRTRRNRITFVGEMKYPPAADFLKKAFDTDRDVRARAAAMAAVGKCGDPDVIEYVVKKVLQNARKEPVFVAQLGRMFESVENEQAAAWMVTRMKQKDQSVLANVVEAVGYGGSPTAVTPLAELIEKTKNAPVKFEALRAIGRCGKSDAIPTLLLYIDDADWRMRMAAAEGLGYTDDPNVIDDLAPLIARHEEPNVVETASEAVALLGTPAAVPPLIKCLEVGRLRARQKARRGLVNIARRDYRMDKDYHVDPNAWGSWWRKIKSGIDPDDPTVSGRDTASYFTFPVHSDRVLFVLDVSGSMEWPNAPRAAGIKPSDWRGRRIDLAHSELFGALRALAKQNKGRIPKKGAKRRTGDLPYAPDENGVEPPTLFKVAVFAGHVAGFPKEPVLATEENVELAIKWLKQQLPRGGTNTHGALEFALAQDAIDTVFFLSDGVPSVGKIEEPEHILADVRRMNRFRRMTINTVALIVGKASVEKALKYEDPEEMADFMNRIATENYGKFADESRPQ